MTQFEVDRMKAAFEYLEDQELYHLEEIKRSNNPDAVKRAQKRAESNVRLLDLVQRTLSEFGVFDVSDPVLCESCSTTSKTTAMFSASVFSGVAFLKARAWIGTKKKR